jgi:signal transduction histidine kinase
MRANPEAIDPGVVFRVYSVLGLLGGIAAFVVAALPMRSPGSVPVVGITAIGLVGALNWTFASYAAAFSRVPDPAARLGGLKAFAIAHLVVGAFLMTAARMMRIAAVRSDIADAFASGFHEVLAANLFVAGAVLAYLAFTATPGPRFTSTIRTAGDTGDDAHEFALREKSGAGSARQLRAQYEEQIRLAARQEERARLARDLHDAVKQQLFVVQTAAATVAARIAHDPSGARAALDQVRTAAREAMGEMAAMLDQLQAAPIENTGLIEALKKQAEALGFRTGATVDVDVEPWPAPAPLPPGAQQAIFRVAQEALANIGRHARASHVTVRLGVERRRLVLRVIDDGAGFDPMTKRTGMGVTNMQERAADVSGEFELASSPGRGTTVSFAVPFVGRSAAAYLRRAAVAVAVLLLCAIWSGWSDGALRAVRLTVVWIAIIAVARYIVAYVRVIRQDDGRG